MLMVNADVLCVTHDVMSNCLEDYSRPLFAECDGLLYAEAAALGPGFAERLTRDGLGRILRADVLYCVDESEYGRALKLVQKKLRFGDFAVPDKRAMKIYVIRRARG